MSAKIETRKKLQDYPGLMANKEPIAAKSAFSYVPTVRNDPKEHNVFNSEGKVSKLTLVRGTPTAGVLLHWVIIFRAKRKQIRPYVKR